MAELTGELGDDGDGTSQDGRHGVGGAARRGEADGGGAESRGSPECRRRRGPVAAEQGQRGQHNWERIGRR
jgi:hypothetical protein